MSHQRTIETKINCSGVGVHSGKKVNLQLLPADINSGIKFIRTDLENGEILAQYPNIVSKGFSTTIINNNGASVNTIEHLMSALWFLNITNIVIKIDSEEMPIMDGSAEYFLFLIESAGIFLQEESFKTLDIIRNIEYKDGDKIIYVKPYKSLKVDFYYESEANHKLLPNINFCFDSSKNNFKYDIARARTFSPIEQVNYLQSKGLATGGSKLNALIINDDKIENKEQLRYSNEPIRHKILDCIGDFYLSGYHINGHFECHKSGHQMNLKILETIFSNHDNYKITSQD